MNGRKLPAALLLVLALMLSACGSSGGSAASLSQAFYAQSSATCSLCYDITLTVTAGSN